MQLLPTASIKFEPRDLWIGFFWRYKKSVESPSKWFTLYICLIPMLPIILEWHWGWETLGKEYLAYRQAAWDSGMAAMSYQEWKSTR